MENLAARRGPVPVFQEYGKIQKLQADGCLVETASGLIRASQAVGCLIRPQPGDKVLVCSDSDGAAYILAVLERRPDEGLEIRFDRPAAIRVSRGRLSLVSQEGIDLGANQDIQLTASALEVHAARGKVIMERAAFLGSFLEVQAARVRLLAGILESVAERLTQKIKRSYRVIEESEHVKAGSLDYFARKWLSFKGRYTLLTAREDVKVDGERIHIG
ncbi:conserved hypothetical protein [uncultured Desulfatiglans sp.]|uniref:DUF3540 domain-containing protein n=1 Tax=Uncultured Desulfatiglans sp. TaxID=1748965 RepID=A0A653AF35_UNCDX|nr:conserved hypothetical protein [uncultured Desulfatiglans sp.]